MPSRTEEILAQIKAKNEQTFKEANEAIPLPEAAKSESKEQTYKETTGRDLNHNVSGEKGVNYNPSSKTEHAGQQQDRNGLHERRPMPDKAQQEADKVKQEFEKSQQQNNDPER